MEHTEPFAYRRKRWATVPALAAIGVAGCYLSAGPALTRPSSGSAAPQGGLSFETGLTLPRTYRFVAGVEWTRTPTQSDLWRAGSFFGYQAPPDPTSRFGWEATARAGFLRSSQEVTSALGGFGGARFGVLMRLGEPAEPQGDPLFDAWPLLVADVGVNGVMPAGQSIQPEVSARLLLRLYIGSALIP
jgi:hypothetical protein